MKKFLILLSVLFSLALSVQAQTGSLMKGQNNLFSDTATAGVNRAATLVLPGPWKTVSLQVNVNKLTGTIAGAINFQGSNDGVYFTTIGTVTATDAAPGTFTSYVFKEVDKGYLWYRVQMALTGASTAYYQSYLYATKPY